ncbi:DUF7577 domain-containing protein [Haloarcula amylovorans]|uniref:DUF7577 domain-containing protein n=1 Tax=Haloarcula amylovorans TaxID=2562280 RepID=UPI00107693AB|nr:zinc ribbon domain-containing protein [Halomicroarcula amylolytica]
MVAPGQAYLLVVTVMALVALVAAAPVLLGIARDVRERLRRGGPDPPTESVEETESTGSAERTDSAGRRCRHCGAENDAGFAYCRACARPL